MIGFWMAMAVTIVVGCGLATVLCWLTSELKDEMRG
jgi:hypothetical protein